MLILEKRSRKKVSLALALSSKVLFYQRIIDEVKLAQLIFLLNVFFREFIRFIEFK